MNFSFVFCAVGIALWIMQIIYKITVCATGKEKLPSKEEYKSYALDEVTKRNISAAKIGAYFFFIFGVLAWLASSGDPDVYMGRQTTLYFVCRFLLPLLLYLNVSLRLLIHRIAGRAPSSMHGLAGIVDSFRFTGLSPQGDDIASRIVRLTNICLVFLFILLIVLILFMSKGV